MFIKISDRLSYIDYKDYQQGGIILRKKNNMLWVGDIHGNIDKLRAFLAYKSDLSHGFTGDLVDSFNQPNENMVACLTTAIKSDALLLYGNHDLQYRIFAPYRCSGFRTSIADKLQEIIVKNQDRFQIAWSDGLHIATHAGIHPKLKYCDDPQDQVYFLNRDFKKYLITGNGDNPIFYIGSSRNGRHPYPGPLWLDYTKDTLDDTWPQIFGHTPYGIVTIPRPDDVAHPEIPHICLDNEHQKGRVCYNTETHQTEDFS